MAGRLISVIKLADVPLPDWVSEVCKRLMGLSTKNPLSNNVGGVKVLRAHADVHFGDERRFAACSLRSVRKERYATYWQHDLTFSDVVD